MDKEILKQIIKMSFKEGENWGVTHSTWFKPTSQQTENKINELIKKVSKEFDIK